MSLFWGTVAVTTLVAGGIIGGFLLLIVRTLREVSGHDEESDRLRGHPIYWDWQEWRYVDTDEPTKGNDRPCGHCGLADTPEGHDGCLGTLPGVRNACCGHGDDRCAYVQFDDGRRVGGREAVELMKGNR